MVARGGHVNIRERLLAGVDFFPCFKRMLRRGADMKRQAGERQESPSKRPESDTVDLGGSSASTRVAVGDTAQPSQTFPASSASAAAAHFGELPSAIENAPHLQAIYQTVLNATIDSIHTKRTTHRGQGEHTANNAFPPKTLKQCRMSQQQKRKFLLRQRVKGTCHHREREDVHGGGRNRWVIRTHGFRAPLVYLLALKPCLPDTAR